MRQDGLVFFFLPVVQQIHGGDQQHFSSLRLKIVRALPHPSVLRSFPGLVHVRPGVQVPAAVKKDFPEAFFRGASQHQIPGVPASPDLGIPGVGPVSDLRDGNGRDDHFFILLIVKVKSVLRGDHQLGGLKLILQAGMGILRVHRLVADSRVRQVQLSLVFHGASGKAAVLILSAAGVQGQPLVLPVYQIPADRMAPVHGPPTGTIGKILVKQMVISFIIDEPVGVVDPVVRGFQMQFLCFHASSV